jgi:hypothetical protein
MRESHAVHKGLAIASLMEWRGHSEAVEQISRNLDLSPA